MVKKNGFVAPEASRGPRFEKFRHCQEVFLGQPCTEALGEVLSQHFDHLVLDAVTRPPYIAGVVEFL